MMNDDVDVEARVVEARRRRRPTRVVVLLVLLVGVPLALVAGTVRWLLLELDPTGSPGATVQVTVEKGWGVSDIADELARHDVIGSSVVFQVYTRVSGSRPFQAGDYALRRELGVKGAIRVLEAGPQIRYQVLRVPPGLWLREIADRVAKQLPGRSAARFIELAESGRVRSRYQPESAKSLEGLLWPDTYKFVAQDDEMAVLRTMVEQFDRQADKLGLGRAHDLTPYQALVVASLIQSEAKADEDRPVIASVVMNRLARDMPLQIDATVLYAIGERKPSNTAADRATESPYNTYLVKGLPPTPISSVAAVSIAAALAPAQSSYLYYVLSDADGHHAFATTYEEHLANVDAARRKGLLG